jgi:hypothetical protein
MANLVNGDISVYIQALVSELVEDLRISTSKDKNSEESSRIEENHKMESKPSDCPS